MEKTKELTLKQRLQKLSEEPIPFFHSLTPFAAGYTQGFNSEKKRLVAALVNNSEVTKDFINESISVPINDSSLFMHAFIDGSVDYRKKIDTILSDKYQEREVRILPFLFVFLENSKHHLSFIYCICYTLNRHSNNQ